MFSASSFPTSWKVTKVVPVWHGCINNRPTITNLVSITQFINQTIADGYQVDMIYTDIAKAMYIIYTDNANHEIIFSKISMLNLCPSLLSLLQSYLVGCPNIVQYNGLSSQSFIPTSGVPPGSVSGASLFNIFISDVTDCLYAKKFLYVDNLKFIYLIKSSKVVTVLQSNLNEFSLWCSKNKVTLNLKKCFVMSYSRRETLVYYQYRKQSIKDLNVVFDSKLTFIGHVKSVKLSSMKSLCCLQRNFGDFNDTNTFIKLYNSYVLSKFNYATIPWDPTFNKYILALEKIQKRFLKFPIFRSTRSYPRRGSDYIQLYEEFNFITVDGRRFN